MVMRSRWKKVTALFMAAVLVLMPQVSSVYAANGSEQNRKVQTQAAGQAGEEKEPPTDVSASSYFLGGFSINYYYGTEGYEWISKISGVSINNHAWEKTGSSFNIGNNNYYYANDGYLHIGEGFETNPATCVITADGYKPLTLSLDKTNHSATVVANGSESGDGEEQTYEVSVDETVNGSIALSATSGVKAGSKVTVTATPDSHYTVDEISVRGTVSGTKVEVNNTSANTYTFTMPKEDVTVTGTFKEYTPENVTIDGIKLETDIFGNTWYMKFTNAGYAAAVTDVIVNDVSWEAKAYSVSGGGAYRKNAEENRLEFAKMDFSSNPTIPALKSGDVITIKADGYTDLTFKLVIDNDGKATLVEDDGKGDPYELHVKIDGSFEAAVVGQKDYDGVSSASVGGSSSNKNSAVKVYGALVEKDTEPADSDWEELDNMSKINLDGSKCSVSIVPDTENGTPKDSDSGMEGVYMTISSDLTLNGTPKDAGQYLISITIADDQGRTATSNALPFRIYTGKETLADQISVKNLKQYESGLYAWDIMEPWVIENFGSNVEGQEESVRVPKDLEAWFGSHESGTYGYLGYDIPWKQVVANHIPQTLYIPDGCNLTLTNMEVLSSVRIVIEKGGKLTLSDSVVQGIIEVKEGGTFSMNYDAYSGTFTTGASVCGQIRMEDGAILENAAIYSHTNYLANGNTADRSNAEAVVLANGNVTVKGQVFVEGDSAGSEGIGQTALRVQNGTLTLEEGATLVTYGGDGTVNLYSEGGHALELENATITGKGKLVAIGGYVLWGDGGTAVTGNGNISTEEVFLQGATAYTSNKAVPGKAVNGEIKITSYKQHIADGTLLVTGVDDSLANLYWKTGIHPVPPLDQFTTFPVDDGSKDNGSTGDNGNSGNNGTSKDNESSESNGTSGSDQSKITSVEVKGIEKKSGISTSISAETIKNITDNAGTTDVTIKQEVKKEDGSTAYTVEVKATDIKAGNDLKLMKKDAKTGKLILVDKKNYTVSKDGSINLTMKNGGDYVLLNSTDAKAAANEIKKTVKATKSSTNVKQKKTTEFPWSNKLNMENVEKITYTTSKKSVLAVNKNGKITAKKKGTAKVKAVVTLKDGTVKTVTMKVKVK